MAATAATAVATATRLLKAGAVLPVGTPSAPDVAIDRLDARTYRSPVLAHPVVSLVAATVAPGEDLVMEFLGFGGPAVEVDVGQALRRAPGFPGWALINDAKHARHALDVVKQMKAVARRIRSKPGHAWDGFVAIAERLGRSTAHFLPSFWEETGRMFIAAGNVTYASRSFGKAREAEKTHALQVELQTLRDSFLEFALHGAVSVKAIGEFARQLAAQHGAAVAWAAVRDLAVKRCQGGLPPWATMLTELRALAAAAKCDRDAELLKLVGELLPLAAVRRAPSSFWEAAEGSLAVLARDPGWMAVLLDLIPAPPDKGTGFAFWWLERLETWGLVRHLQAGKLPDGTALDVAAWVERLAQHTGDTWWNRTQAPDLWFTVFERLAPRLVHGRPLQLIGRESGATDLDLVHLALELGVPLADAPPQVRVSFALAGWAKHATSHPRRKRDPARVQADPRFAAAVAAAAVDALGEEEYDALLPTLPTLLAAASAWAEQELTTAAAGALPALSALLQAFGKHVKPAFLAAAPAIAERLAAFDPAPCLARTLRIGLIDELGWPALEQAAARLASGVAKRKNGDDDLAISGEAPYAVVRNALRAEVVGPAGTVLTHDFTLPAGAELAGCWYRDGQLLVSVRKGYDERWWYWSSAPQERIPHTQYTSSDFAEAQVAVPGGGTSTGYRAQRGGEREPDLSRRKLVGDGRTWWTPDRDDGAGRGETVLRELDLATGDLGRASLPAWFEAVVGPGRRLDLACSHLLPLGAHVDGSCLGGRDGLSGVRVWRTEGPPQAVIETIDGRRATLADASARVSAIARWPGGGERLIIGGGGRYDHIEIWSAEGLHGSDAQKAPGQVCDLPLLCWHAMQPRDAGASTRLRALDDDLARALLEQAREDWKAATDRAGDEDGPVDQGDVATAMPASAALVRERLAATHPGLLVGLLGLLRYARLLADGLRERAGGERDGKPVADALERQVAQGCGLARFVVEGESKGGVASAFAMQGAFLRSADAPPPRTLVIWWARLAELRQRCCATLLTDDRDQRRALAAALRCWADAGLADLPGRWRAGEAAVEVDAPPTPLRKIGYSDWFGTAREGGNAFLVWRSYREGNIFEHAPGGTFAGLAKAPFTTVQKEVPAWWSGPYLRALIAALEDGAPPALDAALIDRAASAAGATRAEAALLLLNVERFRTYHANFLPKELREGLGLKVAEVTAAKERLDGLTPEQRDALAAALMGGDPAGMAALERPASDGTTPLGRLAAAWRAMAQATMEFDPGDETRALIGNEALRDLTALAARAAAGEPVLPAGFGSLRLGAPVQDGCEPSIELAVDGKEVPEALDLEVLWQVCDLAAGFQLHQPAGLAGPAALAGLVAQLRARLADRRVVLSHGFGASPEDLQLWPVYERAWEAARGAAESTIAGGGSTATVRDTGLLLLVRQATSMSAYLRPASVDGPAALATLHQLLGRMGEATDRNVPSLQRWLSPTTQRLLDRLATPGIPAGAFAADPRASAPATVKAAMKRLKLAEDAAACYLQHLALASPTAAAQQRWNAWDADRLAAALAPLLAARLLLKAKRANAGRDCFLPGGWENDSRLSTPIETWKLALYGIGRDKKGKLTDVRPTVPGEPLDELFARAWKRIETGDAPRYEEVK